ncbi:MAG: cupin domain-containing protein [Desulfovibrionaceae bacterium]|nr:cupin domain-containing protein [Desulfovibrionaceae bacterium]MBF0513143.1 cupin domain-containing protein [Desulfovibrionaceae bacterium]
MIGERKFAQRIKKLRKNLGLSIEDLAARTGLDAEYLEALEHGAVSPALGPLLKVSRGLGTRLGTLIDDEFGSDVCVCRRADRSTGDDTLRKARKARHALAFHSLGAGKIDRHMEPFYIEIEPDDASVPKTLSGHEGEEFIVVISGTVEIVLGQERYLLGPGDSIYFNSVVPHHVGAAGPAKASIHAVIYFPA